MFARWKTKSRLWLGNGRWYEKQGKERQRVTRGRFGGIEGTMSDGPEASTLDRAEGGWRRGREWGFKERELESRFTIGGRTGKESSGTLEKWRNCRRGSRLWAGVATGEIRIQLVLHCGSNWFEIDCRSNDSQLIDYGGWAAKRATASFTAPSCRCAAPHHAVSLRVKEREREFSLQEDLL